jgi:RNA polymerase sigma factor (sigma-70 family)
MEATRNFSDPELVNNLRSGISMDDSIRFMYRQYFESLAWFIVNNSGSRQDAEDIFQDVIVSFIEIVQLGKFRGESTIKTFLFSLNRNAWLNELKRRGRASKRELRYEKEQDSEQVDVGTAITDRESRRQLMKIVEALGETCKKILLLYYYENKSMKEILATLDYHSEQVIRNKKYKCLKQLEEMMEKNPGLRTTLKNLLHG